MNSEKTFTIKGKLTNPGSKLIEQIIKDHEIDTSIFYVHSFKVRKGSWDISAKKRDQELTWTLDVKENGDKVQLMEGYSKHYPEFMVNENSTNLIEVSFARLPIENDILESFKEMIKDGMPTIEVSPNIPSNKRIKKTGILAEMATVDAHLAKLAWERETGYRNYDLSIASQDYKYVSEKGLDLIAPFKPELILDIIGNDLFHMDNLAGHTTHGQHTLDVDGRITKVFAKVFAIKRDNILEYRKIAPVRVIWIPGNHDYLTSYMLCYALMQHFKNDPRVTFDLGENPRKAMLWGNLLVGWNHAIKGKYSVWVNELPQQFPELWGKSKFREWHCGDQHKKVDTKIVTPINTVGGVVIRQLTALSPVDKWHTENAFTDAIPGGEVLLWDKSDGVFANFTLWTGQYEQYRNELVK